MQYYHRNWFMALAALFFSVNLQATEIEFRSREIEPKAADYNFKVGNLALDLRYHLGVVYDDNTNRSNRRRSREEGTKIGNALTLGIDWPLNPHIHIQSGVRLGYVFFAEGEGTDGFIVSGVEGDVDGKVAFDFWVGDTGIVTVEERLVRQVDTVEIDQIDNAEDFSLWRNLLSLQYQSQLSRYLSLASKVAWRETWSAKSEFDFRDNSAYILEGILLAQVNNDLQAGPYLSFVRSEFDDRDEVGARHNDTDDFEIGLNFRYQIFASTLTNLSIGYQNFTIDDTLSVLSPQDRSDLNSTDSEIRANVLTKLDALNEEDEGIVLNFTLYNQLSDFINHRLHFSFRRNQGTSPIINFSEDILTSYTLSWEILKDWELLGQFTWLKVNESGSFGELADLYVNLAGIRYHISPKSNCSLDYRRVEKFSSEPNRNYERNEIRFLFGYDF